MLLARFCVLSSMRVSVASATVLPAMLPCPRMCVVVLSHGSWGV